jgi:CRISPR-associated protein Cas2
MMNARLYIVTYDVASPQRWRRVIKAVRRLCRRCQLSVFVCRATPARIERLEKQLRRVLHPVEDRLMIVDLGPAATAEAQLKSLNSITDIADLGGVLL